MIDERSRRREEFAEEYSVPIVLADGQAWRFPKPWLAIRPIFRDGVPVDRWRWPTYGPELDTLVEAIGEVEDPVDQIVTVMALGAFLLLRQYSLSDAELESLFVYRPGEEASREMVEAIIATATGTGGPKRSAAGGA